MYKIRLQNYRSFNDTNDIMIKPLTVFIGQNGAGKSSILRTFPLMSQTLQQYLSNGVLWYGQLIDMKDFNNTVNRRNPKNPIIISLEIPVNASSRFRNRSIMHIDNLKLKLHLTNKATRKYNKFQIDIFDHKIQYLINHEHLDLRVNNKSFSERIHTVGFRSNPLITDFQLMRSIDDYGAYNTKISRLTSMYLDMITFFRNNISKNLSKLSIIEFMRKITIAPMEEMIISIRSEEHTSELQSRL